MEGERHLAGDGVGGKLGTWERGGMRAGYNNIRIKCHDKLAIRLTFKGHANLKNRPKEMRD